jgi:hypothetical protein
LKTFASKTVLNNTSKSSSICLTAAPIFNKKSLAAFPTRHPVVQPKLRIGQSNDNYEQEADRVADRVMSMPEPKQSLVNSDSSLESRAQRQSTCPGCTEKEEEETVQSKPIGDQITPLVQRQEEPEEEEEEEPVQAKMIENNQLQRQEEEPEEEEEEEDEKIKIQTKQSSNQTPHITPGLQKQIQSMKGGGQPLPQSTRSFFEPRFGYDFSQVRVHTYAGAAKIAGSIKSKAFTLGKDITFGKGQYAPGTSTGRKLLAHELTHVIQQRYSSKISPTYKSMKSSPDHLSGVEPNRAVSKVTTQSESAIISCADLKVTEISKDIEDGNKTHRDLFSWLHVEGDRSGNVGKGAVRPKNRNSPDKPPREDNNLPIKAFFFPSYIRHHDKRALILGGIHGNEKPSFELADALVKELQTSSGLAKKDLFFHTLIIPRLNPGGIKDNYRCNRQHVDLNRNFLHRGKRPTKSGGKRPTKSGGCKNTLKAPIQPETKAVMRVLKDFKPHRILSLHAIRNPAKAGIYADPYKGSTARAARKLACSMAGLVVDPKNRRGNRITSKRCNPVYPGGATGRTSLGAFAPSYARPGEIVPVITLEVPGKHSFASFKLTKYSLIALKSTSIPTRILRKLRTLRNKEFPSKSKFITAVEARIGAADTTRYKSLILKYAHRQLKAFLPPTRGFISSPAKLPQTP